MPYRTRSTTRFVDLVLMGIGLAAIFLSGCSKVPPSPTGWLCEFSASRFESVCREITPGANGPVQGRTMIVQAKDMQAFKTLPPDSWRAVSVYIQELRAAAEKNCN